MVRLALAALLALGAARGAAAQDSASRGASARGESRLAIVVNAQSPAPSLDRAALRRIFLLRQRLWSDGTRAAPVNLPAETPLREQFSRTVLGGGSRDFATYWNDLYFHGTQPPPTVASEQAVLLFVARTPGAVGYVSEEMAATLPSGVRIAFVL